ncbi:MAG TPA: helix-turn-helix domain-containing protein [Tepidisphaeraceae bacterium]|jgi:AraC-like DNA-binding protein
MQTKRRKPQVRSATSQRADQTTRARDLADPQIPTETLPLAERLKIREEFFEQAGIDPRQFLRAFDAILGVDYFVKDVHGRTMLNTRKNAQPGGFRSEEQFVGRRAGEYLVKSLADHYEADDREVIRTGQPVRNILEIRFDELGVPDWIITDKYPLCNDAGIVVGVIGTMQSFEGRVRTLPHLGSVGVAADYIRENLGVGLSLDDVAAHVKMSKRHLQRLFRHAIGMSIQQFIIHSRVRTAAQQLTRSLRPLAEIALDCGFSDQSAFTNTFRRLIGLAPREYRKRLLQNFTS